MRAAFWLLGLFALAVVLTLAARFDQGYVIVVYPPWRLEMSFMLALSLGVGLFTVGYFAFRLLRVALRLPEDVRSWRQEKRRRLAETELRLATAAHLAGQDGHARKLLGHALERYPTPLAALLAARLALEAGEPESARQWLRLAVSEEGELIAARQALEARLLATVPQPDVVALPAPETGAATTPVSPGPSAG